ncbi:hypothetical protein LLG07_06185 [bacterium]|nr:hypothetical protein [bacterium]
MKSIKEIVRYVSAVLFIAVLMFLTSCNIFNISGNNSDKEEAQSQQQSSTSIAEDTKEETASSETGTVGQELSEKPDEAVFKEYFSELGLGKLPENGKLPIDLKKNGNIFVSNGKDQLVIYGNLLKDVKLSDAIYDVNAKKDIREKTEFPMVMKKGSFAGSEPVTIPAGKYEFKIWIGDRLVGVFPFEVKP